MALCVKCNHCGQVTDKDRAEMSSSGWKYIHFANNPVDLYTQGRHADVADLCPECSAAFLEFIGVK